jgi:hypothetical protein
MVGGAIRSRLIHRESHRASVLHQLWPARGEKNTAREFCALTTPSLLSRGTRRPWKAGREERPTRSRTKRERVGRPEASPGSKNRARQRMLSCFRNSQKHQGQSPGATAWQLAESVRARPGGYKWCWLSVYGLGRVPPQRAGSLRSVYWKGLLRFRWDARSRWRDVRN